MEISNIIEILDKWNFWNQKINTGFKRQQYLEVLKKYLKMPEIIALTGVRRSGKSTLILQLIEELLNQKINPKNTLYINFEEPNFSEGLNASSLSDIYDAYLEFFNPSGKVYLFLDEVQLAQGWERFVASLYDRKTDVKIFITGSSSKLLMGDISTLLSGRYISEVIYPFDFKEFLDYNKIKYDPLIKTPKIFNYLRKYIEFGGFPRVVIEKEEYGKQLILNEYFNSILERDIILRHTIKNTRDIKEMANFILPNISNLISSYKIEKDFQISAQNARRYMEYFKEAFLLFFASFFSFSVKKQVYRPQKAYIVDTGLRNAVSFKFSDDIGKLLENIVFLKLIRNKQYPYYWENEVEIDFVLRQGQKITGIINVCYSLNKQALAREIKSLEAGLSNFKNADAKLIYWEGKPPKHQIIEFINILDFLIS